MKILQLSTPVLPIDPNMKYGGTERVVRDLDAEYIRKGHESIVVAPGNSVISGRLIPSLSENTWQHSGRNGATYNTDTSKSIERLERHCEMCLDIITKERPDAIHDHTKLVTSETYGNSGLKVPILTTFHGDMDERSRDAIMKIKRIMRKGINFFNSISMSQRAIFEPHLTPDFMIYNAIRTEDYPFESEKRGYLFSIGKMDKNKGQDTAIRTAKNLNEKLVLAGPVHSFRSWIRDYWEQEIEPNIDVVDTNIPARDIDEFTRSMEGSENQIFYVGEVDDEQKKEWFKYAKAFLMPIRWNEPFGLVMIESMASGTPVVAYRKGAVPEIVVDGQTGYIVESEDFPGFVDSTRRVSKIDPYTCRKRVVDNFDISRQADDYIHAFEQIKEINRHFRD